MSINGLIDNDDSIKVPTIVLETESITLCIHQETYITLVPESRFSCNHLYLIHVICNGSGLRWLPRLRAGTHAPWEEALHGNVSRHETGGVL